MLAALAAGSGLYMPDYVHGRDLFPDEARADAERRVMEKAAEKRARRARRGKL